ncbi:MAG TPA: hypothetical protein VGF98_14600 [Candidatus Tumulicola sp.]|jgi:hypothetical protein
MSTDGLSLNPFDVGAEPLDLSDLIKTGQLTAEDLRIPLVSCTAAEVRVYATFLRAAMNNPAPDFLADGYLVVDRGATATKKHGRYKAHIANLVRKQLLVPLNPSASRNQYYLVGCRYDGSNLFASWIQTSIAWRFARTPEPTATQYSKRAVRPRQAERPNTLKFKGFFPCEPIALSLNSNPQKYSEPARQTRARRSGTDLSSHRKSPNGSSYEQRLALASEIAKLTQTPSISTGKHGKLLDGLIRTHGYAVTLKIVHEAWHDRDSLLTDQYPMFTAQTVYFYARYKRTSHRINKEARPTTVSFQQLVMECLNDEGTTDYEQLCKRIRLYGVQRSAMVEAICREFELDPDQLFPI